MYVTYEKVCWAREPGIHIYPALSFDATMTKYGSSVQSSDKKMDRSLLLLLLRTLNCSCYISSRRDCHESASISSSIYHEMSVCLHDTRQINLPRLVTLAHRIHG